MSVFYCVSLIWFAWPVFWAWLSFLCGIPLYAEFFFPVLILRNDKSSLYPKKCYYQVIRMIWALKRIVLCMKMVFKRVKWQFLWQKLSADFAEIKMTTMLLRLLYSIKGFCITWQSFCQLKLFAAKFYLLEYLM